MTADRTIWLPQAEDHCWSYLLIRTENQNFVRRLHDDGSKRR